MLNTILLQAVQAVADTSNQALNMATTKTEETLSLWDMLLKGGPIMIPILILSLIAVYVFIERFLVIQAASKLDSNFMNNIKDLIHNGNVDAAYTLCKNSNSSQARVIAKGISRIGKPYQEIENAMESAGKLETNRLEKNLSILSIVAGIAPMFGFIGTIMGVIKIFYNISLADNISIGLISGGLYEKMITSAAGLVVGVIAFVFYHWINMMIDRLLNNIESNAVEFVEIIQGVKK
jgi:biopolymer transport protein ExbB